MHIDGRELAEEGDAFTFQSIHATVGPPGTPSAPVRVAPVVQNPDSPIVTNHQIR
jgi:hypothetical protein